MIDLDPEGQEQAVRKIVTLLHATHPLGRSDSVVASSRRHVLEAVNSYRGAIVSLVLEGELDVDQGIMLDEIVERILKENEAGIP